MSLRMNLTLKRKASQGDMEYVRTLYERKPPDSPGWQMYFNIWDVKRLEITLEAGLASAVKELDSQAKGWKPVAEGKETHYGIQGDHNEIEYWYQRVYTK